MRQSDSPDVLILRASDRVEARARAMWLPLAGAFASCLLILGFFAVQAWRNIPTQTKRDFDALRACQQHVRYTLPPEPGLEIIDYSVQRIGVDGGPRSVLLAWRAKGADGKPREGLQRCLFETEADGNFPPFDLLSRAVFRAEGEMAQWKADFLAGKPVAPIEPGRPECCLPLPSGLVARSVGSGGFGIVDPDADPTADLRLPVDAGRTDEELPGGLTNGAGEARP